MSHAESVLRSQLLFRSVNRRIVSAAGTLMPVDLVCECGDDHCFAAIRVDPSDFIATARNEDRFIVQPGHEITDVEEPIGNLGAYLIVEKRPTVPTGSELGLLRATTSA